MSKTAKTLSQTSNLNTSAGAHAARWVVLPLGRQSARASPSFLHGAPRRHLPRDDNTTKTSKSRFTEERSHFSRTILEGSTVAVLSLFGLSLGGYTYSVFYKQMVLNKIKNTFSARYFSNELVSLGRIAYANKVPEILKKENLVPRTEQPLIDDIINEKLRGRYYIVMGERRTGKRSLLLESMRKIGGDGIAMLEVFNDLEVFRIRLGK
ncbi:hypothetical protein BDV96DRAFT_646994 [Lophiotrema nucula]|uniref:Uncharacterized protein n=1 Tax=Lophiotrema nucula TaxID=690887 RepID=A0A6A5Z783_9PLEO|nr:hypothetical protein BDV96DRAFT_646994 [Lophiotrema nucula]